MTPVQRLCLSLFKITFLILTTGTAFAQKDPIKFGEVDAKDVSMKSYDKDSEAEAVVLCDYGNSNFEYMSEKGFRLIMRRHTRIKILKQSGTKWGIISFYIYNFTHDKEKISLVKGTSYNFENGQVQKTKLEKESVFENKITDKVSEIKISMPNVKPGTVIEYTYELYSPDLFSLRTWHFQTSIPTVHSEYRVSFPEYFTYVQIGQGFKPYDVAETGKKANSVSQTYSEKSGGSLFNPATRQLQTDKIDFQDGTYRWIRKDVPAFKDEKFITTDEDYLAKIEFQLQSTHFPGGDFKTYFSTWEKAVEDLYANEKFGGYLNKKGRVKDLVATLIAGKTTPQDKMKAIYDYVKNTIQYNNKDNLFATKNPKEVLETNTGNSQEINMLLVIMLKEADIEAYPIISSLRGSGKVNMHYPLIDRFNYVTAYAKIGEQMNILDATDPMRPMNMVSADALTYAGLVLVPEKKQFWVSMQKVPKTSNIYVAYLEIQPTGEIKGNINTKHSGYAALRMRRKLEKLKKEEATKQTSKEEETGEDKEIKTAVYTNIKDYDKALDGNLPVQTSEFAQQNGDFLYITPLLGYVQKENPFKQDERLFPVDFSYPFEENLFMNYVIPEGYKVEELPKPVRFQWQDGSIKYDFLVQQIENRVSIVSRFSLNAAVFEPEDYKHLKELFSQIVAKHQEQIVLKKK